MAATAQSTGAHVLVTRTLFPPEVLEPLAARFTVSHGKAGAWMPRAELLERVSSVDALISFTADRIDDELLSHAPKLKVVATFAVGFDNIDVPAATRHGVWVANTPDVVTEPTADIALLLLLATLRRAGEGFEQLRHGNWTEVRPEALWGEDPKGLTVGVLGLGRIGTAVVKRVIPLGMNVIYHNRTRLPADVERSLGVRWVGFEELLETCDVLTIHTPLSDDTRGIIGRKELARMKTGSFVINAARGPIIDEEALIEALHSGHLAGVGVEVFAREPDVPVALREHPRAFCLPHMGTGTTGTRLAMMKLCMDNVIAVLDGGRPLTPLNQLLAG